jgi:hypothetical protein
MVRKLGSQVLRRGDDQGLEVVDCAGTSHDRASAGAHQHPERLALPAATRVNEVLAG